MPKCKAMFNVPFGFALPASTLASLMSSFASGPERIGLEDAALWPQATVHVRVSTAASEKILFSMIRLVALPVAKLRIQADAEPVPEHVGREHQHRDADAWEDLEPPPPFHQGFALLGHHEAPRRLRRWDPEAEKAQRRLDDHGHADLEAEEHHHGVQHVGDQVPPDDRQLADPVDLRELDEVALAEREHLAPDGARVPAPDHERPDEHHVPQAGPPDG